MRALLFFLFISLGTFAQEGAVGTLEAAKDGINQKRKPENQEFFRAFMFNNEQYFLQISVLSEMRGLMGAVETIKEFSLYKGSTNKENFVRKTIFPTSPLFYCIDSFNKSHYMFFLDKTSTLTAIDLISGKQKVIDNFSTKSATYSNILFSISEDKKKLSVMWASYPKNCIATYNQDFSKMYKYENDKSPYVSGSSSYADFNVNNEGKSVLLIKDDIISGYIATKESINLFSLFKAEKKEYQVQDLGLVFKDNKCYIVGTTFHFKEKKVYLISGELKNSSTISVDFNFQKIHNLALTFPIDKKADPARIKLYVSYVIEDKTILVFYKSASMYGGDYVPYNLIFVTLDNSNKIINTNELYLMQKNGSIQTHVLSNGKIAIVYNDAKNHIENNEIKDYADFEFISSRKDSKRESAMYVATFDYKTNEIKKQMLLESDDKSNLINRFYHGTSNFENDRFSFSVIQGKFVKGAGTDDLNWTPYTFKFKE